MPITTIPFEERILAKVREQIRGRKVGFLLGAGASYLSGRGYPLASALWSGIRQYLSASDQHIIEQLLESGRLSLEEALDVLDIGPGADLELRHKVTSAIGSAFATFVPPLDHHNALIRRLGIRQDRQVPVFTLNYDCLMEHAADFVGIPMIDGFGGLFQASFQISQFQHVRGQYEFRRGRTVFVPHQGIIKLYKLHGSLGWYVDEGGRITRIRPDLPCPTGCRRLMVPPQHRKAADTGSTPYATLWSEFRAYLVNDHSRLLNRLICVGYGFADGHVNAVVDAALQREHFTLIVLARGLSDTAFRKYADSRRAIVLTEARSSLYGEKGAGVADVWSFEWLSQEV